MTKNYQIRFPPVGRSEDAEPSIRLAPPPRLTPQLVEWRIQNLPFSYQALQRSIDLGLSHVATPSGAIPTDRALSMWMEASGQRAVGTVTSGGYGIEPKSSDQVLEAEIAKELAKKPFRSGEEMFYGGLQDFVGGILRGTYQAIGNQQTLSPEEERIARRATAKAFGNAVKTAGLLTGSPGMALSGIGFGSADNTGEALWDAFDGVTTKVGLPGLNRAWKSEAVQQLLHASDGRFAASLEHLSVPGAGRAPFKTDFSTALTPVLKQPPVPVPSTLSTKTKQSIAAVVKRLGVDRVTKLVERGIRSKGKSIAGDAAREGLSKEEAAAVNEYVTSGFREGFDQRGFPAGPTQEIKYGKATQGWTPGHVQQLERFDYWGGLDNMVADLLKECRYFVSERLTMLERDGTGYHLHGDDHRVVQTKPPKRPGFVRIHNHPNGSPPSYADLEAILEDPMGTDHIVLPSGLVYTIERVGNADRGILSEAAALAKEEIRRLLNSGTTLSKYEQNQIWWKHAKARLNDMGLRLQEVNLDH